MDHAFRIKRPHASSTSSFSSLRGTRARGRKIRSEAATTRDAGARARVSYQFDNAHPLSGRRDGRRRSSVSNDVSSSVSFSSFISFTVCTPLTCYRERERERSRRRYRWTHELTKLTQEKKKANKMKNSIFFLKLHKIITKIFQTIEYFRRGILITNNTPKLLFQNYLR